MNIATSSKIVAAESLFIVVPEKKFSVKEYEIFPEKLAKIVPEKIKNTRFEASLGDILEIDSPLKEYKRIFLIGMGKKKENDLRKASGLALRKAKKTKQKTLTFLIPQKSDIHAAVSGALLGHYEFKIGDTSTQHIVQKLTILTKKKVDIESTKILAESTNTVRDLVNLPANMMTPPILAEKAKEMAKKYKNLSVKVLGNKELQKLGMGALYGVGQGSSEESKVIIFEYNGGKKDEAPVAFLGKGVTFDAGGYNIKPTGHIETMKSDMTGAATVFGILQWVAQTKPHKNIVGVLGAVENLVSHKAYKPGDILTAFNGKTIEITNTDAEGRLVLADCLAYTVKHYAPSLMIDIATLTGGCVAALGYECSSVMGNNASAVETVKKAAKKAEEWVWELPLNDFFVEKTKGEISDLVNWTAGVSASSSMGGAFLQNFVDKTPWVHLDIAGTGFHEKSGDELSPKGATGVMMRTLAEIIKS